MRKNSPRFIIQAFTFLALLIITLFVYSAWQVQQSNNILQNVIQTDIHQTEWAHQLETIADQRTILILKILNEDDVFHRDDQIQNFYQLGERFMLTRNKLKNSEISEREISLLKTQFEKANKVVAAQHRVINLLLNDEHKAARTHFLNHALPLQQENSGIINQLTILQSHSVNNTIEQQSPLLTRNFYTLLIGGFFVVLLCIAISITIYRRLNQNIKTIKRANNALSEHANELENIKYALDQHAIVSISDITGKIIFANQKFCEVSQYKESELIGNQHSIINSGYHDKEFFTELWTTIANGKPWHGEICNRKKDGSHYWVETTIVPFLDEHSKPYQYIAIRTEITHIKNTEQDLKISLDHLANEAKKAQESSNLKSTIISTMTHELRTPLNAILGFSQILLSDVNQPIKSHTDSIDWIIKSGNELLCSIDNIMLFSKLKSQSVTANFYEVELTETINSVITKVRACHPTSALSPVLNVHQPATILTDVTLLQKALVCILDNAMKFTDSGTIDIDLKEIQENQPLPELNIPVKSPSILITINDTGIGIPAEKLDLIFDEFRQVDEKDNRRYEGYGIGLSIAKNIIELFNGKLWISSKQGTGTRVYILLPVEPEIADTQYSLAEKQKA